MNFMKNIARRFGFVTREALDEAMKKISAQEAEYVKIVALLSQCSENIDKLAEELREKIYDSVDVQKLTERVFNHLDFSAIAEEAQGEIDIDDIVEQINGEIDVDGIVEQINGEIDLDGIAESAFDRLVSGLRFSP